MSHIKIGTMYIFLPTIGYRRVPPGCRNFKGKSDGGCEPLDRLHLLASRSIHTLNPPKNSISESFKFGRKQARKSQRGRRKSRARKKISLYRNDEGPQLRLDGLIAIAVKQTEYTFKKLETGISAANWFPHWHSCLLDHKAF